ncbi:hypothetical protein BT96DRAFT_1020094 [Gymnopus androsaceus JB14]|uniref:Uncharacterized protein n=1 Tax=Gymnopus androsaceus JB14 TaxID=1447944 RepID=A0A6A4HNQ9_9AGAR|nr:hypothetical protein BT96DRAFT_1020094 [Gymnopus androsaceus JB14]
MDITEKEKETLQCYRFPRLKNGVLSTGTQRVASPLRVVLVGAGWTLLPLFFDLSSSNRPSHVRRRKALLDLAIYTKFFTFRSICLGGNWEEPFSRSRSNFIPNSAVERSQLRTLIEETRRNIQKFEDAQRVQLAKILEFQESLLSPIRTLPPEIINEVSQLVTPEGIMVKRGFMCRFHLSIDMGSFLVARNHRLPAFVLGCVSHAAPMHLRPGLDPIELTPGLCSALYDLAQHADRWKEFVFLQDLPSLNYILKQARNFTDICRFLHPRHLSNLCKRHLCQWNT